MRNLFSLFAVVAVVLAACGGNSESTWPIETAREDVPEDQRAALDDGVVDSSEYRRAFDNFSDCVASTGGGLSVIDVDSVSGLVTYQSSVPLQLPGTITYWENADGEPVELEATTDSPANQCFVQHFGYVEAVFQTTDPLVAEAEARAKREWLDQKVFPCLQLDDIEVGSVDVDSAAFDELSADYLEAVNSGLCTE